MDDLGDLDSVEILLFLVEIHVFLVEIHVFVRRGSGVFRRDDFCRLGICVLHRIMLLVLWFIEVIVCSVGFAGNANDCRSRVVNVDPNE